MKPRLRKINGLWYCWSIEASELYGIGYNPHMAYMDWKLRA